MQSYMPLDIYVYLIGVYIQSLPVIALVSSLVKFLVIAREGLELCEILWSELFAVFCLFCTCEDCVQRYIKW